MKELDLNHNSRKVLIELPIFHDLPDGLISYLHSNLKTKTLNAKEPLFFQEDDGDELFIIASGAMRIERMSEDGKRLLLSILGCGEIIGEMSLITGRPRMADAVAHVDSTLYLVDKQTFKKIISEHPSISTYLMTTLSGRLLNTGVNLQRVGMSTLQSRLAHVLLDLISRFPDANNSMRLDLKVTQSDLADLAVSSREHINKILNSWKADGVLEVKQGYIYLHKPDKLEKLLPES